MWSAAFNNDSMSQWMNEWVFRYMNAMQMIKTTIFDWLVSISTELGVANNHLKTTNEEKKKKNDSAQTTRRKKRVHQKMINEFHCHRLLFVTRYTVFYFLMDLDIFRISKRKKKKSQKSRKKIKLESRRLLFLFSSLSLLLCIDHVEFHFVCKFVFVVLYELFSIYVCIETSVIWIYNI